MQRTLDLKAGFTCESGTSGTRGAGRDENETRGVQAATSSSYSATLDSRDGIGVAGNDCTVDATHERATDTSLEGPLTTRVSTAGLHRKESKGQGARGVSGEQKHWVECTAHKEHRSCVGPCSQGRVATGIRARAEGSPLRGRETERTAYHRHRKWLSDC